jgi:hypothetical protein
VKQQYRNVDFCVLPLHYLVPSVQKLCSIPVIRWHRSVHLRWTILKQRVKLELWPFGLKKIGLVTCAASSSILHMLGRPARQSSSWMSLQPFSNSVSLLLTCCTPITSVAIHPIKWSWISDFRPQKADHITNFFARPSFQRRCHWTSTYPMHRIRLVDSSICFMLLLQVLPPFRFRDGSTAPVGLASSSLRFRDHTETHHIR